MATTVNRKLIDSNDTVSTYGRAHHYWRGKAVKRDPSVEIDGYPDKVDQNVILRKYNLKGFEYGNWLSNNDRFDRLEAAAASLEDLALIMGTKNIGCDGTIGIAFGARGKNKALAHFEPSTFMINLTKLKGAGSLAHEYGHALDYFFGMYVDQDAHDSSMSGGVSTSVNIPEVGGELRRLAIRVVNTALTQNGGLSDYKLKLRNNFPDGYWHRRNEVFARVFEQWTRDKMAKRGIKNTFLSKRKYESAAYLGAADFARVDPILNELVKVMASFMNGKRQTVSIKRETKVAANKGSKAAPKPRPKTKPKPKPKAKK